MASISAIQSMDHRSATKLRKAGVRTTDSLLKLASTRTGRRRLARETGLPEADILRWANRADLLRISGVGSEYADLLEVAPDQSIPEAPDQVKVEVDVVQADEARRGRLTDLEQVT